MTVRFGPLLWRIAALTPHYAADDMSGGGAKATGGRWNRKGTAVLYTSTSVSLACLETLVHFDTNALPLNRILIKLEVPNEVWRTAVTFNRSKHVGWDVEPAGMVSVNAGTSWVSAATSALLIVPSVIVPEEGNVLINPAHPDAAKINVTPIRKWTYDGRLKK